MSLGLGSNLSKSGLVTPGIVTDNLVLKHKYDAASVVPISDGAVKLNGTSEYIDCSSDSSLDVGTNDFSVSAWFKVSTKGGSDYHDIIAKGNTLGSGDGWGICLVESDMKIFFDTNGDVARQNAITSANAWDFDKWYNVTGTRSNSTDTLKLYLNGVLVATNASATNNDYGDASLNFRIGNSQSGRESKGYICNAGYWNEVLTQAQIKSIINKNYTGLSSSEKTNLVSWWNLDTTLGGSGGTSVVVNSHDNTLGEELITGFVNGSTYVFDTLTTSGRNISAAVETSGDWAGAASNSLNLVEGEIYKCTFNLTYNSGTDTVRVLLANSANGAATSVVDEVYYTNTNGVNEAYFRVKTTDSTSHLQIGTWHSSDVINFNMTDISLKRLGGTTGKLI